jgi:2-amino-4-hydroxy-6-hydroxymethyldihydropteridine diphosphokinase
LVNFETAYIGLGSNQGEKVFFLAEAVRRIRGLSGVRLLAVSSLYETVPVGVAGGLFVNAVIMVETKAGPHRLLACLLEIETALGRKRSGSDPAPRNIDLDLLLYGDRLIRKRGLVVPHPRMMDRRFVLEPLAEIAPDLRMPFTGEKVPDAARALKDRCPEQGVVRLPNFKGFPTPGKAADRAEFAP